MKLWEKEKKTREEILKFTVGNDPEYDRRLAPFDVICSMAHAIMLGETGIITADEAAALKKALVGYYPETWMETFALEPGEEDIHSHLENYLVNKVGEAGKKIHTARSRNDQVMAALQLMMKEELRLIIIGVEELSGKLLDKANEYRDFLLPGYTHTQVAMPSSFGLWLGAYAETLVNDLSMMQGLITVLNQNPLGSAAGYGTSFQVDRDLTSRLAGFEDLQVSSVTVQLNRGKLEAWTAGILGSFASTLSRLSSDMIFFMGQDTGFISFPEELTTGSSIMPHKKNPDVLELIRAHCNILTHLPATLNGLTTNLISGYHRDFQLTKEQLIPAFDTIRSCLEMMKLMVDHMEPRADILDAGKYRYIYSVEEVNRKVMEGKSFRDSYREVAGDIESGKYRPGKKAVYTHPGSPGNPGIERIQKKMKDLLPRIRITPAQVIWEKMLEWPG